MEKGNNPADTLETSFASEPKLRETDMAELLGGTTLGLGGAVEKPHCVVLQPVNRSRA